MWQRAGPNRLRATTSRSVETRDGQPLPAAPPLGDAHAFVRLPLKLTRSGRRVLEGQADRVALLGLDRWVAERTWSPTAPGAGTRRPSCSSAPCDPPLTGQAAQQLSAAERCRGTLA